MATGTTTVAAGITDDATFRAWAQGVHDVLAAAGMVRTADTGQINIATAVMPFTATTAGYEVWRFNDELQATAPLFVKVAYGVNSAGSTGTQHPPRLDVTIGRGSDGAGNITGVLWGPVNIARGSTATYALQAGSLTFACHTNDGSFCLATNVVPTQSGNFNIVLCVDRFRNADGSPSGEGIFLAHPVSLTQGYTTVLYDGSASDAYGVGATPALLPAGSGSLTYKGEVYSYPLFPFVGWARNPTLAALVANNTDIGGGVVFQVPMYGAVRSYRMTGAPVSARGTSASSMGALAVRYE